ncbi:VOC family protein [Gallaecimonas sp. GXIMD4217]|uniref:VOC family protein n=1 Tax=Gallaecimonas sp. GXIMD4217 TaxID=3131927 RepID=UPI00311AEFA8
MHANLTHIALHVKDVQACRHFYESYCGLRVVRTRGEPAEPIYWLAEPGRESAFILVLLPGGPGQCHPDGDFSHLGFALDSRAAVDAAAETAKAEGRLLWPPRQEPWPVGYYCGVWDPDGNQVEFSYGQPLGPGADLGG